MLSWAMLAIENESDREFIERLYTQNYAAMLQKAKDILKNHQRAEDAVEAVMLRLIDRITAIRSPCIRICLHASATKRLDSFAGTAGSTPAMRKRKCAYCRTRAQPWIRS